MRDAKAKRTQAYVSDSPRRIIEIKHRHWGTTASQIRRTQRKTPAWAFPVILFPAWVSAQAAGILCTKQSMCPFVSSQRRLSRITAPSGFFKALAFLYSSQGILMHTGFISTACSEKGKTGLFFQYRNYELEN